MMKFVALFEAAEDSSFESLKALAREDRGVLKQVAFLSNLYHGDDPRFTSSEAKTAMAAVLSKLFYRDDQTAFFMGSMEWNPNLPVWMRFFDMAGEDSLGAYLGVKSAEEIPGFASTGVGGEKKAPDAAAAAPATPPAAPAAPVAPQPEGGKDDLSSLGL